MRRLKISTRFAAPVLIVGVVAFAVPSSSAGYAPPLAAGVDVPVENVMAHLREFQTIADANGRTRAHGTPGYKASADYVKAKLDAAGFRTTLQPFTHAGATGWNVIADYPSGDPDNVIFFGAHLDGVRAGPGIHDNGSGSAAILEAALTLKQSGYRPRNGLRFGWWGAEENGLVGSRFHATNLPQSERSKIRYYLNYDMVGAPKPQTWAVYNNTPALVATHNTYLREKGATTGTTNIGGSSDHASFSRIGIAVSGMITDDDDCYHRACDTVSNVTTSGMDIAADVIANVAVELAGSEG